MSLPILPWNFPFLFIPRRRSNNRTNWSEIDIPLLSHFLLDHFLSSWSSSFHGSVLSSCLILVFSVRNELVFFRFYLFVPQSHFWMNTLLFFFGSEGEYHADERTDSNGMKPPLLSLNTSERPVKEWRISSHYIDSEFIHSWVYFLIFFSLLLSLLYHHHHHHCSSSSLDTQLAQFVLFTSYPHLIPGPQDRRERTSSRLMMMMPLIFTRKLWLKPCVFQWNGSEILWRGGIKHGWVSLQVMFVHSHGSQPKITLKLSLPTALETTTCFHYFYWFIYGDIHSF